jgi:hypothetical protein
MKADRQHNQRFVRSGYSWLPMGLIQPRRRIAKPLSKPPVFAKFNLFAFLPDPPDSPSQLPYNKIDAKNRFGMINFQFILKVLKVYDPDRI